MQILYNALLAILRYCSNLMSTEFQIKNNFKIKQVNCVSEQFIFFLLNLIF